MVSFKIGYTLRVLVLAIFLYCTMQCIVHYTVLHVQYVRDYDYYEVYDYVSFTTMYDVYCTCHVNE